jgi:acyl carrier protein
MPRPVEATVRGFIVDNFLFQEGGSPLDDDTSFLAAGLLDSTGVLEMVTFLEETFSIHVADEEIVPDNLDSLRRISNYVRRKLQAGAGRSEVRHAS